MDHNPLLMVMALMLLATKSSGSDDVEWSDEGWGGDSWEETTDSPWQFGGFTETALGSRWQDTANLNRLTLGDIRNRLELNYSADHWQLDAKGDALYDQVLEKVQWQTRELSLSFSPVRMLDIKLGRQILTWGTGDYLFLNDLFPKDWQSFFSGRDDEYLKAPSDGIKVSWYSRLFNVDLVRTASFMPDHTLNGDRFSYFSPVLADNISVDPNPEKTSKSTWSGRISRQERGVEYALYGHRGYWTTPVGVNSRGEAYYPDLNSYGASIRTPLASGLLNAEIAWYDSHEDRNGNNPAIANSQLRWLLGYEREVAKNLTTSAQYYLEWTQDYKPLINNSPYPDYETDEYRHVLTFRLHWRTMQQKLIWSLFSFWSPNDRDAYLKPGVSYRINDSWTVASGANLFIGKEKHTFFGQHENNINIWGRVRFSY